MLHDCLTDERRHNDAQAHAQDHTQDRVMPTVLLAAARWDDIWPTVGEPGLNYENVPVRFKIAARGHSWEVFRNAAFWGIFLSRSEAHTTVRDAMTEIFSAGGSAQMRFA